jgi:hypothetical protein
MNAKIDAFVEQIRKRPKFVAAAASDPKWIGQLEAIRQFLHAVHRNPEMIGASDKILAVIDRSDLSLKQRVLAVGKLLTQIRDTIKIVH